MSDSDSDRQSVESLQEDELCVWIRKCFIKQYDIKKIVNRLEQEDQLQTKLENLSPMHQQFDSFYYLIEQINKYIKQYDDIDLYLESLVKSQSFQNEISERCLLIITQTESINNLQKKIEQLFQIFYFLKDIDMNIIKQSNISLIFTLQKIIQINYPHLQYKLLFNKFDKFLRLIQASAQRLQYKHTPVYPLSLEFIQFKGESKQIFGEYQELNKNDVTLKKYLDYHFNILREDYIYDMRKSISYLSEKGFYKPIKSLYQNITLKQFELNSYDLLWRISLEQFNLDGRKQKTIDWKRSKKLSRGSLICITNVECHPLLFGVITQRSTNQDDYYNLNRINLEFRFLNPKSQIMDFLTLLNQKTILIEYHTQIESCIYFLESIKKIDKLPFENLILKNSNQISFPKYLQNNCIYDINLSLSHQYNGKQVNLLKEMWPNLESNLDDSQREAIKQMLSKEVALIQGPPGTGKTYCGILAVRILYVNLLENDNPILIVCQTNHALESFLESLISFIPIKEIVKLGGVPKSVALQDTHFQCKSEIQFNWNEFHDLKYQLRIIFKRLSQYDYSISAKDINTFWPKLSRKLISDFQDDNDLNNSQIDLQAENLILNSWLDGKCPTNSMLKYDSKLFGMRSYFKTSDITEQVYKNNILESDQKPFDEDYYYRNKSDEDLDEFLDSGDEYEQYDFDNQYEQRYKEIDINFYKLKAPYNFQGIENIQEYIQEKRFNPWELNYNDILEIIKYLEYLKYKEDCLLFEDKYKKFKEMSQTLKHLQEVDEIKKLNKYSGFKTYQINSILSLNLQNIQEDDDYTRLSEQQSLVQQDIYKNYKEAAEVLESHIACILMKNLQHLILIGDHYQLCPQLKCYYPFFKFIIVSLIYILEYYKNRIARITNSIFQKDENLFKIHKNK